MDHLSRKGADALIEGYGDPVLDSLERGSVREIFVDSFESFRASVSEGDVTIPKILHVEPLRAECEHFTACVAERRTPASSGEDGLAVVRTLEAVQRSIRNGGREETV